MVVLDVVPHLMYLRGRVIDDVFNQPSTAGMGALSRTCLVGSKWCVYLVSLTAEPDIWMQVQPELAHVSSFPRQRAG